MLAKMSIPSATSICSLAFVVLVFCIYLRLHGLAVSQVLLSFLYAVYFLTSRIPQRNQYADQDEPERLHRLFKTRGSTHAVSFGIFDIIFTREEEVIKQLLSTNFDDFTMPAFRTAATSAFLGHGILTANGDEWKHMRKSLRPGFAAHRLQAVTGILESHFQVLKNKIPRDGTVFDVQTLIFFMMMDVASQIVLGHSTNILRDDEINLKHIQFMKDNRSCSIEVGTRCGLGPLGFMRLNIPAWFAKRRIRKYFSQLLKLAGEQTVGVGDLSGFQQLAALASSDTARSHDQLHNLFVAARDTTANLLTSIIYHISQNTEIYNRLRKEVVSTCGTEIPTTSDLDSLVYLRWCVQEGELHWLVTGDGFLMTLYSIAFTPRSTYRS